MEACHKLLIPTLQTNDLDELKLPAALCSGQRLKIKSVDGRSYTQSSGRVFRERASEFKVRLPQAAPQVDPESLDLESLAEQTCASISHGESSVRSESGDRRFTSRDEETEIKCDGFKYKSKESRQSTERPGHESRTRSEEEKFKARG